MGTYPAVTLLVKRAIQSNLIGFDLARIGAGSRGLFYSRL